MTRSAHVGLALAAVMLGVPACTSLRTSEPVAQTIAIDGWNYRVEQLTASTWTATPAPAATAGQQTRASLVRAIEKASACKVTDSDDLHAKVFTAQVDCGSRLKN